MKTCPKCKTTGIPDDAKFCPVCGAKIILQKKDPQQLMQEALSAWEKYPNKPQKASIISFIICVLIVAACFSSISYLLNGKESGFNAFIFYSIVGAFSVPFFMYKDNKDNKKAKDAFIKRYINEHENDITD